jgi:hypothetical protein
VIAFTFDEEDQRRLTRAGRHMYAAAIGSAFASLATLLEGSPAGVVAAGWLSIAVSLTLAGRRVRGMARARTDGDVGRALWHLRNAIAIKGIAIGLTLALLFVSILLPFALALL